MKNLCSMLFISSLLCLASCADLPQFKVCKELTPSRAKCIDALTEEKFDWDEFSLVDGKTYFEERPTMLQVPAESYAKIKSYLLKNCKKYKNCPELEKRINAIDQNQIQY